MIKRTPQFAKATELAVTFLEREVSKRCKLDPEQNPSALWAGVTLDGRIFIGTPVLPTGTGFYVDRFGHCKEA